MPNLLIKLGILFFVGAATFVGYPILSFTWAMGKIEPAFKDDCGTALQYSKHYNHRQYSKFHSSLIGKLIGYTPKYYFLTTIGICEYKVGNKKEAVKALNELKAYVEINPYPHHNFDKYQKLLEKTEKELTQ